MQGMAVATPDVITLTDHRGHARVVCELPRPIRPDEISRLHHQILLHFQADLRAHTAEEPLHLPWPEVVRRLEQRIGVIS